LFFFNIPLLFLLSSFAFPSFFFFAEMYLAEYNVILKNS
jgi:hypothetical protein